MTISLNFINAVDYQIQSNVVNKKLKKNQLMILKSLRNNPNIILAGLYREGGFGYTTIQDDLNKLLNLGIIKRIGSSKLGYLEALK